MSNLALPEKFTQLATQLNDTVTSVINANTINGFQKAFITSTAISKLEEALTDEYMKPIMALQGNRLGFKTDKDKEGGYPLPVVKKCLIEAVLMGLQPYGNEFNIIAGNMYATKEGMGAVLKKREGLSYEIIPGMPDMDTNKQVAKIKMQINWMLNGAKQEREIEFAIKVNSFMGADAVIGKATRKARKWLHDTISGFEIPEGDVNDSTGVPMASEEVITAEDLQLLYDMKKDALSAGEKKSVERVITNQETENYKKVKELLKSK